MRFIATRGVQVCLGFLFFCCSATFAQPRIQNIQFEGLKKTKQSYLEYFIDSKTDEFPNLTQISQEVQRLKNLNGIANAAYRLDTLAEGIKLIFEVEEALTFFPIVNFGGIRGNFWYQLGFTDVNWTGRGTIFNTYYQNIDRRSNFNLYYRVPYVRGSPWGFSVSALRFASVEPLYFTDQTVFYDYTNLSFGATGIYEINRNQFIEAGATYFVEDYAKNERHQDEITPGPDALRQPKTLVKLIHQINRLNYHFFYLSGMYNQANLQAVYTYADESWFHIFINDFRYFKRISEKGNFALRFRLGISTNNLTPFAPFVLDSYVNIRGSGNRIDRGTAALILNLEHRQTVFENSKFAAQLIGFSDSGTWRNPGGSFSDLTDSENFRLFMGGGIRLIYKKAFNAILRLDYGVDLFDGSQRGFVLGVGQYF